LADPVSVGLTPKSFVSVTRYASVLGLGFGDCGKGLFVDALTRRWQAHTVVRFSGGAQAGHNVIAPGAGHGAVARHHTFSQFGSGSFVPGTRTMLLAPMIVHPTALLVEAEALQAVGVGDALPRLTIDAQCLVTTPFHQAAGRLREGLRGGAAHGSCGVGVGETMRVSLDHPELALRYEELAEAGGGRRRVVLTKLEALREKLLMEFQPRLPMKGPEELQKELSYLQDAGLAQRWLNAALALTRQCPPCGEETLAARLQEPGCVVFEGAQGLLLDEWRGFHPHTTWSSITTKALEKSLARLSLCVPIEHCGVLRTYLTRHGAGPFPTHDGALDVVLPEPHNASAGWQGDFRRGHPDAVLLRYALETVGDLSGLFVSHMDALGAQVPLRWCQAYRCGGDLIQRLPVGPMGDLDHQRWLTHRLKEAMPVYADDEVNSEAKFREQLSTVTDLPIVLKSYGNTHAHVRS